jgi:hypothetical protein
VTAPSPQDPWLLPTAAEPAVPPRKGRFRRIHVVWLSLLALAVLCCGGVGLITVFTGPSRPKAAGDSGAAQNNRPLLVFPSTSTPTSPTSSSDPTSAAPVQAQPSVRAATSHKPVVKPKPKPTTRKPTPKPTKTTRPAGPFVHPGAFCAPRGARGVTSKGTPMVCKPSATDPRNRWRKA